MALEPLPRVLRVPLEPGSRRAEPEGVSPGVHVGGGAFAPELGELVRQDDLQVTNAVFLGIVAARVRVDRAPTLAVGTDEMTGLVQRRMDRCLGLHEDPLPDDSGLGRSPMASRQVGSGLDLGEREAETSEEGSEASRGEIATEKMVSDRVHGRLRMRLGLAHAAESSRTPRARSARLGYPRSMHRIALLAALSLTLLPSGDAHANEEVRGITVSTHTSGWEWGTDAIVPTFTQLRELGANWVAIHPYAGIRGDGTVRTWDFKDGDPPAHITRPIEEAHRLGMKILVKPHLAYWGSPFSWRGEITFETEEEWQRFWDGYERWIVGVARAAKNADAFVVGTELDKTLGHEATWRRIIAAVRKETSAPLTYAANWPDYQRVGFWDALDTIGIQAYFPVAGSESPARSEIERGWASKMKELSAYAGKTGKDIVFTELGYNRSFAAPLRPWEYQTDGPEAESVQRESLEAALAAVAAEPRVVGAFLWKWFPEPRPIGRNFQLATPGMRQVIREAWGSPEAPKAPGAH